MAGNRDEAGTSAVSDEDRQQVAERLTEAVGEGQLTLEEFSQRVERAYAASTPAELEAVLADLSKQEVQTGTVTESRVSAAPVRGGRRRWKLAFMGGSTYRGRWRVSARNGFAAFMGGHTLDLSRAILESEETDIILGAIMGGHTVIVPRGVRVVVSDTDIMGGTTAKIDEEAIRPGAPVVRVRSYTFMGGNTIKHPK